MTLTASLVCRSTDGLCIGQFTIYSLGVCVCVCVCLCVHVFICDVDLAYCQPAVTGGPFPVSLSLSLSFSFPFTFLATAQLGSLTTRFACHRICTAVVGFAN